MKKKFNLQHAIIGFINTGLLAFIINLHYGNYFSSILAGLFQGLITFFIVGINTAFFEYLYFRFKNYFISVFLPSFFTSILSFIVHTILKSPSPSNTALGIFIFAFINFSGLFILMKYLNTIKPTELIRLIFNKIKRGINYCLNLLK